MQLEGSKLKTNTKEKHLQCKGDELANTSTGLKNTGNSKHNSTNTELDTYSNY